MPLVQFAACSVVNQPSVPSHLFRCSDSSSCSGVGTCSSHLLLGRQRVGGNNQFLGCQQHAAKARLLLGMRAVPLLSTMLIVVHTFAVMSCEPVMM